MNNVQLVPSQPGLFDWRSKAACQGDMGSAFYPPLRSEKRSIKEAREKRAKKVCASCVVRTTCLDQALHRGERYGIWGGLTDLERQHLRAS
ncbi:WhiB family transcriptional regulator [Ilumatobacter sp.]|uniref:WhiB family transcriptional regulator n=1 Tax=Ilumatobacter sp. TaxID=1967498 RepID=UPI003753CE1D